jgi:hypothetical protein
MAGDPKRVLWPWIAIAAGAALAVLLAVLIVVIALVP